MKIEVSDEVLKLNEGFDYDGLPYSLEAERSVLGALILQPENIAQAISIVSKDSFYAKENSQIFEILVNFFIEGLKIDFITVLEAAVNRQVFSSVDDAKIYLNGLMDLVPSISNLKSYCKIVSDKFILRRLILAAKKIEKLAIDSTDNVEEVLDIAEQEIFEIRKNKQSRGLVPIEEVVSKYFENLDDIVSGKKKAAISSGYASLDSFLTGFNPSDLIVLAARPAMGKTSFALNIVTKVAKQSGKDVVVFSLEMSAQQLAERMLASESDILSSKLRIGDLSSDEFTVLAESAQKLIEYRIFFDDSSNITVAEMKSKLRRFPEIGLVVIDYLQLMSSGKKEGNRVQEISEITRMLKILAKELNVAVIAISQLARSPEARQDHRPILSDLRESGSIEQDADVVLFLYRDEYYNPDSEKTGIAECIVAKNRHGETGSLELGWEGQFTRFVGLDRFHDEIN